MHRDPVDEDMRVLAGRPEEDLQLMRENQHELDLCKQTLIVYRSRIKHAAYLTILPSKYLIMTKNDTL